VEIFVIPAIIRPRVKTGGDFQGLAAKKFPYETSHFISYIASSIGEEGFKDVFYYFR
jgi:hypothetical protein